MCSTWMDRRMYTQFDAPQYAFSLELLIQYSSASLAGSAITFSSEECATIRAAVASVRPPVVSTDNNVMNMWRQERRNQ